ncbi:MAG: hypothetical protein FWE91_06140 [Defluviitaleaceae bacterium]|nr:hypothetical protein [Defluviitaleaceae bacterium]
MIKARILPLAFKNINAREKEEFNAQLKVLGELYGDVAEFMSPLVVGSDISDEVDAVVFPQLVGEAFSEKAALSKISLPVLVITSQFGTVEMWDWEIVTFLRDAGLTVFSPYTVELARCVFRAVACKKHMRGIRFLMFQDDPGEGMQANIFKRFYWWEKQCTEAMEETFGLRIIYKSYKELNAKAGSIDDNAARDICRDWDIPMEGVSEANYLKAVKIYMAAKEVIDEIGGVEGVGANCLNESFHSETTPCLAWNMLFERDNILWVCEGDTLSLISKYIFHSILKLPIMMTNIYPFLAGMAALKHEKIDSFPDVPNADNHALCAHCGYFGFAPRSFCTDWILRPAVLEIVNENAVMADCRMAVGPVTLAKLHPDMKKLTLIECEIADYAQYPGSDCRNGALLHYVNNNGHEIMDALSSHHALLIQGEHIPAVKQAARVFGFEVRLY